MCESFALRDSKKKKKHRNLALTDSSYDMFAFRDSCNIFALRDSGMATLHRKVGADRRFVRYVCAA